MTAAGPYPANLNRQIHGLRGLSALLVFIAHLDGIAEQNGFLPAALNGLEPLFFAGRHGVEIFFAISGYLITDSLLRHRDAGRFLLDRAIRIYPVFLAIHLLVFGLGPLIGYRWMAGIGAADWAAAFVSNALFLPGLFKLPIAQMNAWSLSYEAGFYLLAAAVFVVARRAGRGASIALLMLLLPPIFALHPKALFFGVGALVYGVFARRGLRLPPPFARLSIPAFAIALALLARAEDAPRLFYVAALPVFLFFWSIVGGRCPASSVLRIGPLQYLGTISYSFYLWAPVVTFPLKIAVVRVGLQSGWAGFAIFGAASLVGAIAVSHLSYVWLESRVGRALRAQVRRRRRSYADAGLTALSRS